MRREQLELLLLLCGIGHIVLSVVSTIIPKALNWKKELGPLQPLLRQMFWTYAAYILILNFCFGIVSIFGKNELLNHSFLAKSITLFISLYWLARVFIQFFYFDTTQAPKGLFYTIGEIALIILFIIFTIVYAAAFLYNSWIIA
ncbi:MAG: hypothetical protein JWM14_2115 [Chitinophagaceae bacterium]|nr:hypothetical protein [Chitinophagaceae bacterium]